MYSLVSHIAVVGASVSRYSTRTSAPATAAAPYDGRGASVIFETVMISAREECSRHEHEVRSDEQDGRNRQPAGHEIGVASDEHERGGPATQLRAGDSRREMEHGGMRGGRMLPSSVAGSRDVQQG